MFGKVIAESWLGVIKAILQTLQRERLNLNALKVYGNWLFEMSLCALPILFVE